MNSNRDPDARSAVTIVDVAKAAGVSLATASRVLRASGYPVSAKAAARVRSAAKRLGYVPNLNARNLRSTHGNSLGLIVGDMRDPYFAKIAALITAAAYRRSLLAVVANMHREPALEIAMCRKLWEHRVDGLILAGGGFDQLAHLDELRGFVEKLQGSGVTVVSLSERNLRIPSFSADNELVGRALADALIMRGHRSIGVAAGPRGGFVAEGRIRGIRAAIAAAGVMGHVVHSAFTTDGAIIAADELLAKHPRPTSIITLSDTLGVGVLQSLQRKGIQVPGQMSVLSVGNTDYCDVLTPRLTSMEIGLDVFCDAAIQYIEQCWSKQEPTPPPTYAVHIVERETTGSWQG